MHPSNIPKEILEELLRICTLVFRTPKGALYEQTNGVSMGAPMGPNFANFYMCHMENSLFDENRMLKPTIYCDMLMTYL